MQVNIIDDIKLAELIEATQSGRKSFALAVEIVVKPPHNCDFPDQLNVKILAFTEVVEKPEVDAEPITNRDMFEEPVK